VVHEHGQADVRRRPAAGARPPTAPTGSPTRRPRSAGVRTTSQSRYGTPGQAWAYWQARRYYGPLL